MMAMQDEETLVATTMTGEGEEDAALRSAGDDRALFSAESRTSSTAERSGHIWLARASTPLAMVVGDRSGYRRSTPPRRGMCPMNGL